MRAVMPFIFLNSLFFSIASARGSRKDWLMAV